jgi:hypothetical protein
MNKMMYGSFEKEAAQPSQTANRDRDGLEPQA